jgi:uncharacterized protein YegL
MAKYELNDNIDNYYEGVLTIIFVVEASESMSGSKIETLNDLISNTIPEIRKIATENPFYKIEITVLKYADNAVWITPTPVDVFDFEWKYLGCDGESNFGAACYQLENQFRRKRKVSYKASFCPIIFLFTNSGANGEYSEELYYLYKCSLFKQSMKVALIFGDKPDEQILYEFTGNRDTIEKTLTPETITKYIKFKFEEDSNWEPRNHDIGFKKMAFARVHRIGDHAYYFTGEELKNYWIDGKQKFVVGVTEDALYFLESYYSSNDYIVLHTESLNKGNILKVTFDDDYNSCTCFIENDGKIKLYTFSFDSHEHSTISLSQSMVQNIISTDDSDEDDWF